MNLSLQETQRRAVLAEQVYARGADGRNISNASHYNPNSRYQNNFSQELNEQYEITVLHEGEGDVIMSFNAQGALVPAPVTQLLDNVTDTSSQLFRAA